MKHKAQALIEWLKQAWNGCFNVYTHVAWRVSANYQENLNPEYFEKAVMALASSLIRRGVISVHQAYDIRYDAQVFRANLKDTFDKRKIH